MKRTMISWASVLLAGAVAGCFGCDAAGPKGEDGLDGDAGPPGAPGDAAARAVYRSTFSSTDDQDNGTVADRSLTFTKAEDDSAIRLNYYDSFTINGGTLELFGCQWMVLFNDRPCVDPGTIVAKIAGTGTTLETSTVSGWCTATDEGPLTAGEITVTVRVGTVSGVSGVSAGDCITGLGQVTGFIEAEELD